MIHPLCELKERREVVLELRHDSAVVYHYNRTHSCNQSKHICSHAVKRIKINDERNMEIETEKLRKKPNCKRRLEEGLRRQLILVKHASNTFTPSSKSEASIKLWLRIEFNILLSDTLLYRCSAVQLLLPTVTVSTF